MCDVGGWAGEERVGMGGEAGTSEGYEVYILHWICVG